MLAETNQFLTAWKSKQQKRTMSWEQRMENTNTNWESCRSAIFETMLCCQAPTDQKCSHCDINSGYIKCTQCCGRRRLCGTCDQLLHENQPFHDRQYVVAHGFFQYIKPTESTDDDGNLINISKYHTSTVHFFLFMVSRIFDVFKVD